MKAFFALLAVGMIATGTAQSQTQSVTKPANATATNRYSVRPPTTPASATTSPNRQQELYDQYHGVSKRPSSVTPTPPAGQPAVRPVAQPVASAPVDGAERPVSLDGSRSGVRIGFRGGITRLVYLDRLPDINADPTVSFVGGFVFNFGQGTLSFQPELNYARYALKNTNGSGSPLTQAINQFEVPLMLKIASGPVNTTRFFLNIGPYGAYTSSINLNGQNESLDNATGRFSFGATAGIGAAVKVGQGHLTFEIRTLYRLSNAANGIAFNTEYRALNTQATVGYMIPLGGR